MRRWLYRLSFRIGFWPVDCQVGTRLEAVPMMPGDTVIFGGGQVFRNDGKPLTKVFEIPVMWPIPRLSIDFGPWLREAPMWLPLQQKWALTVSWAPLRTVPPGGEVYQRGFTIWWRILPPFYYVPDGTICQRWTGRDHFFIIDWRAWARIVTTWGHGNGKA